MTAAYCLCGHLKFAHSPAIGGCDMCDCSTYRECATCGGSRLMQAAPVTSTVDWDHATTLPCPGCCHG